MAVQDVSKLPEQPHSFVQPSPYLSTPPIGGSRYLDALKRSVKPKPKPRPSHENRRKTEPRTRPEPTKERPKPDVERSDRARPEPSTGDAKLREAGQPTGNEPARGGDRNDATRIETIDANVDHRTQETTASQPAGETTTEVVGDLVSPPPAGLAELFSEIKVDAAAPGGSSANQSAEEPTAPSGLATLVSFSATIGGPGSSGSQPGNESLQTTLTTADESFDHNPDALTAMNSAIGHGVNADRASNESINQTETGETQQTVLELTAVEQIEQRQAEEIQTQQIDNGAIDATTGFESNTGAATTSITAEAPGSLRTADVATGSNPTEPTQPASSAATSGAAKSVDAQANPTPLNTAGDVTAKEAKPITANGTNEATTNERGQFAQRVVTAVRGAMQGNRTFKAVLHPPELGVLQVEITGDKNGNLVARLEVNTPAAQQALQDNLSDLRAALTRQGITLDRIEIQLNESNSNDEPGSQGREESRQQQREHRERQRESKEEEHAESTDA